MTARNRSRSWFVGTVVAALLAPLAFVVAVATPASATPGKLHEIYMYKVEKYFDIGSEYPDNYLHEHLYCNNGDIPLDGMWRIDSVDQAQPSEGIYGDERDVIVYASYPDDDQSGPYNPTEWHFRMENLADGDAKVHLWVTCIRGTVEYAHGHTHGIDAGMAGIPYRDDQWNHFGPNPLATTPSGDTGALQHSFMCPAGSYAVAPGFNFLNDDKQRIYGSWTTNSAPAVYGRGWQWAFITEQPSEVRFYLRCLNQKVFNGGPGVQHSHRIPIEWRPNPANVGSVQNVGPHRFGERRINCDDNPNGAFYQNYKAMVGGFWIYDWHYVWYLGMDPRPKQRSFKFMYFGPGDDRVALGALCVRARTEKQIKY